MSGWKVDTLWIFADDDQLVGMLGMGPESCPFFDAVLTETLNGVDRLEFSIPGDHPRADQAVKGRIVVFETVDGEYRAFRIQTQWQGLGDDGVRYRRFYCEDIAIDELNAAPVIERRPNNPLDALIGALEYSIWEVGRVDSGFPPGSTSFYHESAMSCIQKIVETWGGDIRFRITHDGWKITGRYVDFLLQRGSDNGRRITVGKNMRTIEAEDDLTGLCTALYGYGRGEETETGGFSRRISFKDVVWSKANGDPVDKPSGQEWVGDPDVLAVWGLKGGTIHRFGFVIFEDETDPEALLQKTWDELQKRKAPLTNYKVGMTDLEAAEGLRHEAVRIGDWVTVIDDDMSPPLEFRARIIEIKRHLNNPEETEITIGEVQPTLADEINRIQRDVNRSIKVGDSLNLVFETLADELRATPGYTYISPTDGILVTDKPKDQNPTSAIQLKGGMLAIASSFDPAKGDFNWRAFGTGTGFVADEIRAGTLNASLVQISTTTTDTEGEKKITLYDGYVDSYYDGKLSISVGGYAVHFYPWGSERIDPAGLLFGGGEGDGLDRIGLVGAGADYILLAQYTPGEPIGGNFYIDYLFMQTYLMGPAHSHPDDLCQMYIGPDAQYWYEGNPRGQPSIYLERGLGSNYVANVRVRIGDSKNPSAGGIFSVHKNTGTGSARLFEVTTDYVLFDMTNMTSKIIYIDDFTRIDTSGSFTRWQATNTHYIMQSRSDGTITFFMNGVMRHQFKPDGTKVGGTIEIDGRNLGMSPVDSPRVLISDMILDQPVNESGVLVTLDSRLAKAVSQYMVIPSHPDVVISEKTPTGFKVSGPSGTVDLLIIGIRSGKESIYFEDLGPVSETVPAPEPRPFVTESEEASVQQKKSAEVMGRNGKFLTPAQLKQQRAKERGTDGKSKDAN